MVVEEVGVTPLTCFVALLLDGAAPGPFLIRSLPPPSARTPTENSSRVLSARWPCSHQVMHPVTLRFQREMAVLPPGDAP